MTTTTTNQSNVSIVNLEKFKDTVLFSITIRKWGNSARIKDMNALEAYLLALKQEQAAEQAEGAAASDKATEKAVYIASERVKSNKKLVSSKRYEKLCSAMTALKARVEALSMPSFFRSGMFVCKTASVPTVESTLKAGWESIVKNELADFLDKFAEDVEAARSNPVKKGGLGPLFLSGDYPDLDTLKSLFAVEWYWMALSVPENIPDELKAEANEKFKRRMEDAADQIEQALRAELLELVSHAEERLTSNPGEKPKIFRDSIIGNLTQFLQTFESRDIFGDDRLKAIVDKAKAVMLDANGTSKIDAQKLRDLPAVRAAAKEQFAKIKAEISGLVEEKGRKLDLSEE